MDHQRFKLVAPEGTTLYIGGFGIFVELFQSSSGNRWNEYLVVGKTMVGVRFLFPDESVTTRYFHHDHLGSIAVITSESGTVVERNSHDAWGKRRFPNGDDDTAGSITSLTTQGFTGQEELTGFGLVHLNGRVYDPLVARMMSADPLVPEPLNGQAWNRYSYVINNPLAFTDPSGYSWLSDFFHGVQNLLRAFPIIGAIIRIAAVAILCGGPQAIVCAVVTAAVSSAVVAGITTGRLGAALQAGVVAGATALAFYGIGEITSGIAEATGMSGFGSPAHVFNVAGHAAVGCGSSVASGGGCGSGALSAGIAAFAGPVIPTQNTVARLVAKTVVGGVASVASGGKFENGAITAAFGYLFNELRHQGKASEVIERLRSGSPTAAEMIKRLEESSRTWTFKLDDSLILPGGSPGMTNPFTREIIVNPSAVEGFEFRAPADGQWYSRSVEVVAGHELGHAVIAEDVGAANSLRGFNVDLAIRYENLIARELDPSAPLRQLFGGHNTGTRVRR